jgi:hypothetical protein
MSTSELNFHQSKYKKDGPFSMDDLQEPNSFDYQTTAISDTNDYLNLNSPTKKRSTQNERLRTQKTVLESENARLSAELANAKAIVEAERQKALDLQSQHLELTAQAAMEVGNTKALVGSLKDMLKTEAQRNQPVALSQPTQTYHTAAVPQQQLNYQTNPYVPAIQEESFYSPQQEANINKLLNKFNFLDPRGDNYSPQMFQQADEIQRNLLDEYKRQGRGEQEYSPEFTKTLEDRLNMHFNNNNNQPKSARMVAPVGGANNFMMDSNIALQPEDIQLIKGFKNHFGEEIVDVATQSLKHYRTHPEESVKGTLMKDMMYNPFNQNL